MSVTPGTSLPNTPPHEPLRVEADSHVIACALARSGYRELRETKCEISNRVVTLRGTVSSYFMKQLAQETVRRADPGHLVRNLLRVESQVGEQN